MKYKTFMLFRNLAGLGAAGIAAVGAFVGCRNMAKDAQTVPSLTVSPPPASVSPAPKARTTPAPKMSGKSSTPKMSGKPGSVEATALMTPRDTSVIALRKQPLSNGKASGDSTKWVAIGNDFKAEFRADSGSSTWDRVKIDLDNDKKWDERWDFKSDGSIKRRMAPRDDEDYTVEYRLKPGATTWIRVK